MSNSMHNLNKVKLPHSNFSQKFRSLRLKTPEKRSRSSAAVRDDTAAKLNTINGDNNTNHFEFNGMTEVFSDSEAYQMDSSLKNLAQNVKFDTLSPNPFTRLSTRNSKSKQNKQQQQQQQQHLSSVDLVMKHEMGGGSQFFDQTHSGHQHFSMINLFKQHKSYSRAHNAATSSLPSGGNATSSSNLEADHPQNVFRVRIRQLNESDPVLNVDVPLDAEGQWLLDEICDSHGGIQEKDFFGFRYFDKWKQKQWLDLGKNIYEQLKDIHPINLSFRIKHYPQNPLTDFISPSASYQLYLQLRKDLYRGWLLGRSADLYTLAAYAAQNELGDYSEELYPDASYIGNANLIMVPSAKIESKICEIHKTFVGMSRFEAERTFMKKAAELDTYGVEPFYVKDQKGNNLYVGLTHEGVSTFQGSRRAHLFTWSSIAKIHFQAKLFILQVYLNEVINNEPIQKKHILGFKCDSSNAACALWKWAIDRHCFFTLKRSSEAKKVKSGGNLFKRGVIYKFTGRCHKELMQNISGSQSLDFKNSQNLQRQQSVDQTDDLMSAKESELKSNDGTITESIVSELPHSQKSNPKLVAKMKMNSIDQPHSLNPDHLSNGANTNFDRFSPVWNSLHANAFSLHRPSLIRTCHSDEYACGLDSRHRRFSLSLTNLTSSEVHPSSSPSPPLISAGGGCGGTLKTVTDGLTPDHHQLNQNPLYKRLLVCNGRVKPFSLDTYRRGSASNKTNHNVSPLAGDLNEYIRHRKAAALTAKDSQQLTEEPSESNVGASGANQKISAAAAASPATHSNNGSAVSLCLQRLAWLLICLMLLMGLILMAPATLETLHSFALTDNINKIIRALKQKIRQSLL